MVLDLRRGGSTVIFSTHDMAVAERMCDSIFMIYQGRKVLDGSLRQIQQTHGRDVIHVRLESNGADAPSLDDLPGVLEVTDFGNHQEMRCSAGADRQQILAALMSRGRVEQFQVAHPSLHDIFMRIARPQELMEQQTEGQSAAT
jgi:ABC-2 type transport system ATP-binding protein